MNNIVFNQSPNEVLDYTFSFVEWLTGGDGVELATVTHSRIDSTAGSTLVISDISIDPKTVQIYVTGGILNAKYKILCKITTLSGLVKESTITMNIKET